MSGEPGVAFAGVSRCWSCGRMVKHRPNGGPQKRHGCCLRWLSRRLWSAHQKGWHSGYRFAVENRDDEMVLADAYDYGRGWAGYMRAGGVIRVDIDQQPPSGGVSGD